MGVAFEISLTRVLRILKKDIWHEKVYLRSGYYTVHVKDASIAEKKVPRCAYLHCLSLQAPVAAGGEHFERNSLPAECM